MTDDTSNAIEITQDLIVCFLDESALCLTVMDEVLLVFEERSLEGEIRFDRDDETINEIFRAAHSLKGLAASFGMDQITRLTHSMETVLDKARQGITGLNAHNIECMLECVGHLEMMIAWHLDPESEGDYDDGGALERIEYCEEVVSSEAESTVTAEEPVAVDSPAEEVVEDDGAMMLLADPELREIFLVTTEETVQEMDQQLLNLEESQTTETLQDLFRTAHNLKSAFGSAGILDGQQLTHDLETVLDRLISGNEQVSESLISRMLRVADRAREILENIRADCYVTWTAGEIEELCDLLINPESSDDADEDEDSGYSVEIELEKDNPECSLQVIMMLNQAKCLGEVSDIHPDLDNDSEADLDNLTFHILPFEADFKASLRETVKRYAVTGIKFTKLTREHGGEAADAPVVDESPDGHEIWSVPAEPASEPASEKPAAPVPQEKALEPQENKTKGGGEVKAAVQKSPVPKATRPSTGSGGSRSDTIRVDVSRLDELMNLGGELVINRARFSMMEREFKKVFKHKDLGYLVSDVRDHLARALEGIDNSEASRGHGGVVRSNIEDALKGFKSISDLVSEVNEAGQVMGDFTDAVGTLERIAGGLQKRIMDTRMVPVGPLFTRFRRVVRDIAKGLGKQMQLEIKGETTELDKRMIDELSDPLTHLIRNSADHGIEPGEDRAGTGKPPIATIRLEAYQQGNNICIEVSDDGRGIHADKIKKRILERELATPTQVEQMTDKEIIQFVFHPGFSMAEKVSDISGRGMGMDIVMAKVSSLNGVVEVETKPGEGTSFILKLPLTMAIATALLAEIGSETYAIPLDSVAEIVTCRKEQVHTIQGAQIIRIRDRSIPVFFIEDLFPTSRKGLLTRVKKSDEWTTLILAVQDDRMGLVVDRMIAQEEVVIKSLAENYKNISGITGATILGDGRIAPILDPAWMIKGGKMADDESGAMNHRETTRAC